MSFRGHQDYLRVVQVDDYKFISGANDGRVKVYDTRTGNLYWETKEM